MYKKTISKIESILGVDAHYFVSNGFLIFVNQLVSVAGSLITALLLANLFTEEDYGIYRYLIALTSIFSLFTLTGMSQAILQTSSKGWLWFFPYATTKSFIYSIGLVATALTAAIYYFVQDNLILAMGCLCISLIQPFINVYFQIFSYLTGLKKFIASNILQALRILTIVSAVTVTTLLSKNILYVFFVFMFAQMITSAIGYYFFKPKNEENETDIIMGKKYLNFAKHQSIQNIFIGVAQKIDAVLIFQFIGSTQLAIYSIAMIVPEQINSAVKNFTSLLFPKYSSYSLSQFRGSVVKRSKQMFFLLFSASIFYILISAVVINTLFPKYHDAVLYSQILALAIPTSVLYISQNALKSQTDNKKLYSIQLISAIVKTTLTAIGVIAFGLMGAVAAAVTASYVNLIIQYYFWNSSINEKTTLST